MSFIFPKWANTLPLKVAVGAVLAASAAGAGITYYLTPKWTRVGYTPKQPVAFSHKVHNEQLGIDCRYCHSAVEKSWFSNIPAASTCMNCHSVVKSTSPLLAPVRESYEKGTPVPWVWSHTTPDYAYFNHSIHVNRGISCVECHGKVNEMDTVRHVQPLSMAFCIECHRNPESRLRDPKDVFNLDSKTLAEQGRHQEAQEYLHDWKVKAPQSCSGCHR